MMILIAFKIMLICVYIVGVEQAPTTMFEKFQKMIFGKHAPIREIPYLFGCDICMTFWSVFIYLTIQYGVCLDVPLIAAGCAYVVPLFRELMLGLRERGIWLFSKI